MLVIGATNRPDSIDPALRRAGRFDREVCLGIPNVECRAHILKVVTSSLKLAEGIDFGVLARNTPGFVGADLMALTREAALAAVNRYDHIFLMSVLQNFRHLISRVFNDLKTQPPSTPVVSIQDQTVNVAQQEVSKSEEEIIVDGDVPKESQSSNVSSNSGVVVIDDDPKPSAVENSKTFSPQKEIPPPNPITEKLNETPKSPLELLLSWLREQTPLTAEQLSDLRVKAEDFERALKCVQPSAKREGFATVPDVTWDDVGSLQDIREELKLAILVSLKRIP